MILPSFGGEGDDGAGGEKNKVVSFTNTETPNLALQAWFLEELVLWNAHYLDQSLIPLTT